MGAQGDPQIIEIKTKMIQTDPRMVQVKKKQSFFNNYVGNKIQFHSGMFSHLIFEVIEDKKKELKILSNKIKLKISKDQKNLLFRYV